VPVLAQQVAWGVANTTVVPYGSQTSIDRTRANILDCVLGTHHLPSYNTTTSPFSPINRSQQDEGQGKRMMFDMVSVPLLGWACHIGGAGWWWWGGGGGGAAPPPHSGVAMRQGLCRGNHRQSHGVLRHAQCRGWHLELNYWLLALEGQG
jgi:hypothetical protein